MFFRIDNILWHSSYMQITSVLLESFRYTGQAFKAANQAIGRLIRNTQDYGALILLDRRYAGETLRQMLPGWVRGARRQWHARSASELEAGFAAVAAFFAQKQTESQLPNQRQTR